MVYKWKYQPKGNVQPQTAGEELERIMAKNDGRLTPAMVVAESRNEGSVLYNCFEWDDTIAAEKHREHQAQYIIVQLVVEENKKDSDEKIRVRALVSIDEEEDGCFYTTIQGAMSDPAMRQCVLDKALKDLRDWKHKYKDLQEFTKVFDAIESVKV